MSYLESSFCGAAGQKIKVCIQFSFRISIQESDQVDVAGYWRILPLKILA